MASIFESTRQDYNLTPEELSQVMTPGGGFESSGELAALYNQFFAGGRDYWFDENDNIQFAEGDWDTDFGGAFIPHVPNIMGGFSTLADNSDRAGIIGGNPLDDDLSFEIGDYWIREMSEKAGFDVDATVGSDEFNQGLDNFYNLWSEGNIDDMPWEEGSDIWDVEGFTNLNWGESNLDLYNPFWESEILMDFAGALEEAGSFLVGEDENGELIWSSDYRTLLEEGNEDILNFQQQFLENKYGSSDSLHTSFTDLILDDYLGEGAGIIGSYLEDPGSEGSAWSETDWARVRELNDPSNFSFDLPDDQMGSFATWMDDWGMYMTEFDPTGSKMLEKKYQAGRAGLTEKFTQDVSQQQQVMAGGSGFQGSYMHDPNIGIFEQLDTQQKGLMTSLDAGLTSELTGFESQFYSDIGQLGRAGAFADMPFGDLSYVWEGPEYADLDAFLEDWTLSDSGLFEFDLDDAWEGLYNG